MGEHIFKRHNKTLLMYHLVFPLKYRKSVINEEIGEGLKEICFAISERYEVHFIEIGYESNHVHFFGSKCSKLFCFKNGKEVEKYYSKRII